MDLNEHEKLALKSFGSLALMMSVKWALIIGISRAARKAAEKAVTT